MTALLVFGVIIGILVIYLALIIFTPVLKEHQLPMSPGPVNRPAPRNAREVAFDVDGETVRGTWYLPLRGGKNLACLVLNNGFGGTRDMVVPPYAERFSEAGYAVLTFDYRHFGESGGRPRQWYNGKKQVEDVRAAVAYARSRPEIDPEKIVLWGTSGGAPYGFLVAAGDRRIAGVISQCGALDHRADERTYRDRVGIRPVLRVMIHAQRDKGRSRFGLPVHHIPIVGPPDSTAILNSPDAFAGYEALAAGSRTFRNELAARTMLTMPAGSPVDVAEKVGCPALIIACEKDNLASPTSHVRVVEALKGPAKVVSYPIGHFDVYSGEWLEKAFREMVGFLGTAVGD